MAGMAMFLALAPHSSATTHIIQFGGSVGFAYSPSAQAITIGDTIEWQGNFSFHPLSSTTIPAGAPAWHNGTGSVFDYVATLPGTYNYQCDNHFSFGMVGTFTATLTGVSNEQTIGGPASFRLEQNFPNPFNPTTTISYALPKDAYVSLAVYDLTGQKVTQLVDRQTAAGSYQVVFDATGFPSGIYFYRLQARQTEGGPSPTSSGQAGAFEQTKKLLLLK